MGHKPERRIPKPRKNSVRVLDRMPYLTGRQMNPLEPKPEDFDIDIVAHALSLKCRYNGHAIEFFSVAQHAILVSMFVEPEHAMWGLMHELDEVFLPDIPRPLKPFVQGWEKIAEKHMIAGAAAFGLTLPMPPNVKYVDSQMLHTEQDYLMPGTPDWDSLPPKLDCVIKPMTWQQSETAFHVRYNELQRLRNPKG
jgi:uncharacterized protein